MKTCTKDCRYQDSDKENAYEKRIMIIKNNKMFDFWPVKTVIHKFYIEVRQG